MFVVAMLVTAGVATVGLALLKAKEEADRRWRLEVFAKEHDLSFQPAVDGRPPRLSGRMNGISFWIHCELVSVSERSLTARYRLEVQIPAALPRGLRVWVGWNGGDGRLYEAKDVQLSCSRPDAERGLRERTGIVRWMADAAVNRPSLKISGGRLVMAHYGDIDWVMDSVEGLVGLVPGLMRALRWRPDASLVDDLPPPGVHGFEIPDALRDVETTTQQQAARGPRQGAVDIDGRLGEMMSALASGGELESEGSFTLDAEEAFAKLRRARLDRAEAYILDLVRAGIARGTRHILVGIRDVDLVVRLDGVEFGVSELERLDDSVFASSADDAAWALRHLALGLHGALGKHIEEVRLVSQSHQLVLSSDGSRRLEPNPDGPVDSTTVYVRTALRNLFEDVHAPALQVLRQSSLVCPHPVVAGHRDVARARHEVIGCGEVTIEEEGIRGFAGFDPRAMDSGAKVMIGQHGLVMREETFPGAAPGFRCVLMLTDPVTDVSGAQLVDGPQLARAMRLAQAALGRAYAALVDEHGGRTGADEAIHEFVCAMLYRLRSRAAIRDSPAAPLIRVPVWPLARGGRVDSQTLFERFEQVGRIEYAQLVALDGYSEEDVVLASPGLTSLDRALLVAWFGDGLVEVERARDEEES